MRKRGESCIQKPGDNSGGIRYLPHGAWVRMEMTMAYETGGAATVAVSLCFLSL